MIDEIYPKPVTEWTTVNDGELKMFSHIHDRLPCGDRYCDILSTAELAVAADAAGDDDEHPDWNTAIRLHANSLGQ